MNCLNGPKVLVNSLGASAFSTSPGPTPVDSACHPQVPSLGHLAGSGAARQAVPGSNVPAESGKKFTARTEKLQP